MENLISLIKRLWLHLSFLRRWQFGFLLLLMFVSALAEVISLGAVLPFVGILTSPELVLAHPVAVNFGLAQRISSTEQLVLLLTVLFAAAALLSGVLRVLLVWASNSITFATGADIGIQIYRSTLNQPYQVHISRNSSEVISGLTNKVNLVVFSVLLPCTTFISSTILLVAIMLTLIAIDPAVALISVAVFGAIYALITLKVKKTIRRNSVRIAKEQTQVVKALQEGLGGIRDLLLDGTQEFYCKIYRDADIPLRKAQASNNFISTSPKYLMESLGMVFIAGLALVLSQKSSGVEAALPLLAAMALGAQRLLPTLQQLYLSWSSIAGSYGILKDILQLLDQPLQLDIYDPQTEKFVFKNTLRFESVSFRYSTDSPWVINNLNLIIPKRSKIGFVGSTGSGKTTTIDLLMGLLKPTIGNFMVDDKPLGGKRLKAWQRSIAHVPQSIYLADSTFAENIAFGVSPEKIDMPLVKRVAQQAQIADFIESRSEGYHQFVGELGIQLSGGQRQRIGIARALYKQANVLVFDEATSALDTATERSVIKAIEQLEDDLSIIIIAHRLSTVKNCDNIIELADGKVVAQGSYEELLACSPSFRKLAGIT